MLQQTTVAAVVPYFEKFLAEFPTVQTLAAAEQESVLRRWEGLGYYSRARNIHKAAQVIVNDHAGEFPETVDELIKLPGIGRYTAGAISSFAFDLPAAIVEANTLRLYCRLMGYADDPRSTAGQKALWEFADNLVPAKNPGLFNQALMELGSIVCKPKDPNCRECPVKTCCTAMELNQQDVIPQPKKRPQITDVTEASIAVYRRGKFLLRRRSDNERWAGLWDFVRFEIDDSAAQAVQFSRGKPVARSLFKNEDSLFNDLSDAVYQHSGIRSEIKLPIREIKHAVTRYRIRLLCFRADYVSGTPLKDQQFKWIRPADFEKYPLSVTGRKLAESLQD